MDLFRSFKPCDCTFHRPYIIAEAGVNREGSIDLAKRLIEEAKEGGADAIKFQTYQAETIACKDSPSYWDLGKEPTTSQCQLFKKYDKFWKTEYEVLKRHCGQVGIEFISAPFDVESAAFLNDLMEVFKISSSDINNKPFIDILCAYNTTSPSSYPPAPPGCGRWSRPWAGFRITAPIIEQAGQPCAIHWEDMQARLVLTGTSLGQTLDKQLVHWARNKGIPSVSVIEHWSWHHKRFEVESELVLPDYILVNDEIARAQAIADGLPEVG